MSGSARRAAQLRLLLSAEHEVDAALVLAGLRAGLVGRHAGTRPLSALDNVADLLLAFEPPPAAVGAVEVEFDVFLGDSELLNRLSIRESLLSLADLGHDLLDELAALHLELGLDVVG